MKTLVGALASLLVATAAPAATIVTLDPASARFDSSIDNDDPATGFGAGNPSAAENNAGLTFNVIFTPGAGDLNSSTQPVNVVEIGGDANGSGLYLLGGELHFISKMNGNGTHTITAFNDLDWNSGNNMVGARSSFGSLSVGVEYSVAVVFDPITTANLQIGVLPTGGSLTLDSFSLLNRGTRSNWSGDDSASAFRGGNIGNFGGANQTGGDTWSEAGINANPFEGDQGQALYWSQNGTIIPEPSMATLVLLGGLTMLAGRRRRR